MQTFTTPMMKQYQQIKKQYMDCLLFFRMGDFYELFMDDAHIGAKVLDIALTSRPKGKDGRIPMAGVPFHAVDSYLAKLVKAGYKVAICEQVSEPDKYGIVDREVIRVVTPGTVTDEKALIKYENNYLISLSTDSKKLGLAIADLSTGQFQTTEYTLGNIGHILINELSRLHPTECILSKRLYDDPALLKVLKSHKDLNIYCFHEWDEYARQSESYIKKHFGIHSLESFSLLEKPLAIEASAALLGYLKSTQKDQIKHIKKITTYSTDNYVHLDRSTIVNLELFSTIRDQEKKGSLIEILDETITAMGGRKLRELLRQPLTNKEEITERHNAVEELLNHRQQRAALQDQLKQIADIERIVSRLSIGVGNARDLITLKNSLITVYRIKHTYLIFSASVLRKIQHNISPEIHNVINIIETYIKDEPNIDIKSGNLIKDGIHKELDHLRKLVNGSKNWITKLEEEEKKRTGIGSLKVNFNKVFGFYIEISNANLHLVPKEYMRKQTLVNGERFITPELKEKEETILKAEEKMNDLEYELFQLTLKKILQSVSAIQQTAQAIALLDCFLNFAFIAEKNNYCRPKLVDERKISISGGRHPVVEQLLEGNEFVPNDTTLNDTDHQLLIITGPNMAGKSVLIRQVAILVLMSQIGSFIPARDAEICVVDRIFVRSGASDMITSGLSTFMVEMIETAQILHHATKNSLIIMDEIGRGTSTYDGISIAWAVAEYLVTNPHTSAMTLFATHYHELQSLEKAHSHKIKNYQMAIQQHNGEPIFLHTIVPGGASHSHGVAVAKLAGVPDEIIQNAIKILQKLEKRSVDNSVDNSKKNTSLEQLDNQSVLKELKKMDIYEMTPLEALNTLAELKSKLKISQIKVNISQGSQIKNEIN